MQSEDWFFTNAMKFVYDDIRKDVRLQRLIILGTITTFGLFLLFLLLFPITAIITDIIIWIIYPRNSPTRREIGGWLIYSVILLLILYQIYSYGL